MGLINADLADTLGNLVQRVTAKKLHPPVEDEKKRPVTSELASEWRKISETEDDRALIDHLNNLSGMFVCVVLMLWRYRTHALLGAYRT